MIILKIWLAGVVLIWLLIILNCIFYLCYDWRWYFKGELPPRSGAREVRRLVKAGRLKEPVEMHVEMMKDKEGVVFAAIIRFEGTSIIGFCDTIGRKFEILKRDFCASFLLIFLWPVVLIAMPTFALVDMVNDRVRRRKK